MKSKKEAIINIKQGALLSGSELLWELEPILLDFAGVEESSQEKLIDLLKRTFKMNHDDCEACRSQMNRDQGLGDAKKPALIQMRDLLQRASEIIESDNYEVAHKLNHWIAVINMYHEDQDDEDDESFESTSCTARLWRQVRVFNALENFLSETAEVELTT